MTPPARPPKRRRPRPRISPELRALRRAARIAYRLSVETGTPFYVWKDGKVVDLLAKKAPAKRRRPTSGPSPSRQTTRVKSFTPSREASRYRRGGFHGRDVPATGTSR